MANNRKRYYLTRNALFSTLENAVDHAKNIDTNNEVYDDITVFQLDELSPMGVYVIDSYTGELGYIRLNKKLQ